MSSSSTTSNTPKRRRNRLRRALCAGVAALVLVCAAWSGLWLFAARAAQTNLDNWILQEADQGRLWACQNTKLGGFPLRLEIICSKAAFSGEVGDAPRIAHANQVRLLARIWNPDVVHIAIKGPLRIESAGQAQRIDVKWTRLQAEFQMAPQARQRLSATIDGLSARPTEGGSAQLPWSADQLMFDVRPSIGRANAYDIALTAKGAASPALRTWLASGDPVNASLQATVPNAAHLLADPSLEGVEAWLRAGGAVTIENARVSQNQARIEASGRLTVDSAHRLKGRLRAQESHLGPLLARLGAPSSVIMMDSLIGSLALPITFDRGRLSIGPFLTSARLISLY